MLVQSVPSHPSPRRTPGQEAKLKRSRLEELLCAGQLLFGLYSLRAGGRCTNAGRVPQPQIHPLSSVFSPRFSCLFTSHDFLLPSGMLGGWKTRRKTGVGIEGRGPGTRSLRREEAKKVLAPRIESESSGAAPLLTLSAALSKTVATRYFQFRRKQTQI